MQTDSNQKQERSVSYGANARAIQPYNFIPFVCDGDGKKQSPPRQPLDVYYPPAAGLKSGWMDVKLTTKTPLIIPDGAQHDEIPVQYDNIPGVKRAEQEKRESKNDRHKRYRFFRFPDHTCGIPGSELRGMIRSMYEAATNSCLPFLLKDHPISQRTPIYGAFKNRGLLEYDPEKKCWRLLKVKKHLIATDVCAVQTGVFRCGEAEYHTAQKVRYSFSSEGISLGQGISEGIIQFNIPVDLRNRYNVAVLEPVGVEYEWPPGDKSAYDSLQGSVWDTVENVTQHGKKRDAVTTQSDLKRVLKEAERGEGTQVPVYWFRVERTLEEDGAAKTIPIYYLSGAAAGRVQQRRKWADIMGEHRPCDSLNALCPACALFGTADAKEDMDGTENNRKPSKDRGARGRLRFTDAHAVTEPEITSHTLQILGEPRSSSFEFYLRKPAKNATYWNYDYYGIRQTVQTQKGKTVEWTEYHDLPEATPRGRKFYWHTYPSPDAQPDGDRPAQNKMNATMEVASTGSVFTFRVYFDRITDGQLQDLLWLISLGENREDSHLQYKLGHAKPLGYGSVKLTVTDCVIRELDADFSMRTRRVEVPEKPERPAGSLPMDSETMRAILCMSDTRATGGKPVEYLTGMDKGKPVIYAWFRENRINADAVLTLPEPWESDLTLPTQRRSKRKGGNGGRTNRNPETHMGGESSQPPVQEERLPVTITENTELAKQRQETRNRIGQEVECTVTDVRGQTVYVTLKGSGEKCKFTAKKKVKYKLRQTVRAKITGILPDSTPKLEVL